MGTVQGFEDVSTERIVVVHDSHHLRLLAFDCDVIDDHNNNHHSNNSKHGENNQYNQNSNKAIDSSHFRINFLKSREHI